MKEPIISNNKKNTNIEDEEFSLPPAESILDHLSSGIFILDCKWSINYVNKSMEKWVGKNRNQLIGFNIWEALPEAVGTDFYYFYHQAMEERISVTFEDYY